tara:strand:- start:52 stop:420 length:369 start_codon:yes stop_codon:yes gene_type:complete
MEKLEIMVQNITDQVYEKSAAFGGTIKALRQELGLTQVDLAILVNKSQGWITQIENGVIKKLDIGGILQLSAALQIEPTELIASLGLHDGNRYQGTIIPRLSVIIEKLSKDKQLALAKVLKN